MLIQYICKIQTVQLLIKLKRPNLFRVKNNLYLNAKSCVSNNESASTLFPCQVEVTQGDILPGFIFNISH